MKFYKLFLLLPMILIVFMCDIIIFKPNYQAFSLENDWSEIVVEKTSKRVLLEKNSLVKRPMASTTKILTALCVIENSNLSDEVEITKDCVGIEGSSVYLKEGEKLKVIDLLYGLMLRSGNDCAVTLSKHVSGNIDNFSQLMNITAKRLGAESSNFVNPHGLPNKNHYTTAKDLALITCGALENSIFQQIVSTKKYVCKNNFGETRVFYNKNKMLSNYENADGVKTGYTKEAGRCLVSSATKNNMQLVSVVLGCSPMFERSSEILDDCFSKYSLVKLVEKNCSIGNVEIYNEFTKTNDIVDYCVKEDIILPISKNEGKTIKYICDFYNSIKFPFENDKILGELKVYVGNELQKTKKLYIINGQINYNFNDALSGIVKNWGIYENKQVFS